MNLIRELKSKQTFFCDKSVPYREAIGSLMYLIIETHPEVAFAIGKLSKFCGRSERKHWYAVKHLLQYISGSKSVCICYGRNANLVPYGYRKSDWGGDVETRKLVSGYLFMMAEGEISWASRKQTIVVTSTCEAEYIAVTDACKKAVWLLRVVSFVLKSKLDGTCLRMISGSQSAIKMSVMEGTYCRNKHI